MDDKIQQHIEQVSNEASEANALLKERINELESSNEKHKRQPKQKIPCGISVSIYRT